MISVLSMLWGIVLIFAKENLHCIQKKRSRSSPSLVILGHEQLATTMRYLDISTADQIKAMATLEDENNSKVSAKWKNNNGSLKSLVTRQ